MVATEEQTDQKTTETGLVDNPTYCLKAVPIFMAGSYEKTARDKDGNQKVVLFKYDANDLDTMSNNFKTFCTGKNSVYEVPVVIGHEQNQEVLDMTGLPAAGWIRNLWVEKRKAETPVLSIDGQSLQRRSIGSNEHFLLADIGGIPQIVAQWIKDGKYRYVSAEVTEPNVPPPGVPCKGRFLLRLSILGATPPHIKQLGPLPTPTIENINTFSQAHGNRIGYWLRSGSFGLL